MGVAEFVAEIRCPKDHPKSEKSGFVTEYGDSAFLQRFYKQIPELEFSLPIIVHVAL